MEHALLRTSPDSTYKIYDALCKAGTIVVKRRQQLHLFYRRDLQGGLQPVRGTAGGDVCRYGFVAVSDPVKIVPDEAGLSASLKCPTTPVSLPSTSRAVPALPEAKRPG